ncbi:MAG: 2-amino-4-hydroxy-6-hydroxymethyldihydropteridine diphosphokinase [Bryobacteraceae bacterium]
MKTVYIGLGSNLGDRRENLKRAMESLAKDDLNVMRESSIYETEPRDIVDQPWFLNQVVEAETELMPRQLLARLEKIERGMGRKLGIAKGPRLIDLDILLYGDAVVSTADLEIPHPRMTERRFVLEPLAEIAPGLRHPRTRKTVREMLDEVSGQVVRRVES